MVVVGSGTGYEILTRDIIGKNVSFLFDDHLQDLSLQGPLAVDYLEKRIPGVRQLKYFHHLQTTLFGNRVMISRTGYMGERGYEIFCRAENATEIWDTICRRERRYGSSRAPGEKRPAAIRDDLVFVDSPRAIQ